MTSVKADGFAEDRFAPVKAAFESNFASGQENGASFCMTLEGKPVVDIWAGYADEAQTKPWKKDTIVNVYSTTKTMTALTALFLADKGALDFAAPVAKYWPEFAANGKADVTVAQLMSHSAGLSGWKEPLVREDLYDWEKATSLLAAQAPYWKPGTAPGYHAMTQGYLVGEVIRRVAGETVGNVFRKEIAGPLGADFHIGRPSTEDHRVADLTPPPPGGGIGQGTADELVANMSNNPPINPLDTRTRAWRAAEIPAAGGTGNARSVAAVQSLMANG
ncbi:MAG: serine hydrolase domain-containing protein, partial [Hyphomonas sp.]|nr:serine hydrolase domain-containing protein [Hyphomonas sp.]